MHALFANGIPGSGKSTLASHLSGELGFPVVAKDGDDASAVPGHDRPALRRGEAPLRRAETVDAPVGIVRHELVAATAREVAGGGGAPAINAPSQVNLQVWSYAG